MSRHSHWAGIVKTYESVERVGPRGKECRLAAERWGWQKAGRGEEVAANDEIITRSQAPTQLHTQHTNTYTNTHTTHKHNRIQAPTQLHPVCALWSMCCFVLSISLQLMYKYTNQWLVITHTEILWANLQNKDCQDTALITLSLLCTVYSLYYSEVRCKERRGDRAMIRICFSHCSSRLNSLREKTVEYKKMN